MDDFSLTLPSPTERRAHVLRALDTYWPGRAAPVAELPIPTDAIDRVAGPLRLTAIQLPEWAHHAGADGRILVPSEVAGNGDWARIDWWTAAFLLLECWHERIWERRHGPIHSYSWRLKGWDERAWRHAWVNRIGILLATWAGLDAGVPRPDLRLSHDVDAVRKTAPIRLKQTAMRCAIALRGVKSRDSKTSGAARFALGRQDWWMIDEVLRLEHEFGVKATFNVFADPRRRSPQRWLMDPSYRLGSPDGARLITTLLSGSARIGLHPSFDSWQNEGRILRQRAYLEHHIEQPVASVRQHWLRFSWDRTWTAQSRAGLQRDATLMFNDRAGFRNSAAIEWKPWNPTTGTAHEIAAIPCGFMDSHQYDYDELAAATERLSANGIIEECRTVGGAVELLWHPHTLAADFGWRQGFVDLLREVAA
jgi:hypothetical protein